jgi:hypothetical protein
VDPTQVPLPVPEETETDNFEDAIEPDETSDMPSKDMPSPYARDAPKFHYEKPEELNRYIRRLEELFSKHSIDDEHEKIKYLGAYADARTEKEWEAMATYDLGVFENHKKEIIDSYPEASNEARGSIKELKRIRDSFLGITCQDLTRLQAFKRAFTAEAKRLQTEPAMLSNHEAIEFFLKPLSSGFKKKIIDKLEVTDMVNPAAANKDRCPEDRFPLEKIIETAVNIARGMQASYRSSDSSSSGGDGDKREMCAYVKVEQDEIGNTLAQLQDQQKLMEKHFLSALEQMNKSLQQVIQSNSSRQAQPAYQAPTPVYQNQGYQPQVSQPRQRGLFIPGGNNSSCFYCDEEGHMKDDCPHRHKHLEKGWIIIDAHGRATQPDGRMIPFTGGNTMKMRVDTLNGVPMPRSDKATASNVQSLIGKPGVIQLSQSIGSYAIPDQQEIENELEKFDLNDLVQYVSTRSGQGLASGEALEKGFPRVQ